MSSDLAGINHPSVVSPKPSAPNQRSALIRAGSVVRRTLDADPVVYRIPAEQVEIYGVPNFLMPDECRRMIQIVDRFAKPSKVFHLDYASGFRTSYSGDVDPFDPFVMMIERRIDDLMGIPHEWGETIQGQRYAPGQEFKAHCDFFHTDQDYWAEERRRGGQRSWTAMAYLNTVPEGGSTDFPRIGLSVPPVEGTLLIWNNMNRKGDPNGYTLHAGTPVVRGTKYIVTKWYRSKKWG